MTITFIFFFNFLFISLWKSIPPSNTQSITSYHNPWRSSSYFEFKSTVKSCQICVYYLSFAQIICKIVKSQEVENMCTKEIKGKLKWMEKKKNQEMYKRKKKNLLKSRWVNIQINRHFKLLASYYFSLGFSTSRFFFLFATVWVGWILYHFSYSSWRICIHIL